MKSDVVHCPALLFSFLFILSLFFNPFMSTLKRFVCHLTLILLWNSPQCWFFPSVAFNRHLLSEHSKPSTKPFLGMGLIQHQTSSEWWTWSLTTSTSGIALSAPLGTGTQQPILVCNPKSLATASSLSPYWDRGANDGSVTTWFLTLAIPWAVACQDPLHRILQARILEWVAISFYRGSSWPRNRTQVSYTEGRFFTS